MRTVVSLRGLVPPLAIVAAATILAAGTSTTAFAEPTGEPAHPRTTTVNRTQGLDPEGDTVTVSGIGHTPGSRIEITTRAVPAEAIDTVHVDESAVLDEDNTVFTDVDGRGLFSVTLDTGTDFAAEAGLDTEEAPFEIVVLDAQGTEEGPPTEGADPTDGPEGADRTSEPEGSGQTTADDDVLAAPGAGMSTPVQAPAAPDASTTPAVPTLVATVPVGFAAPASAPEHRPQITPRSAPQSAPQTLPRTPGDPSLSVSKTNGLDPDGETVTVTGSGYDTAKGIYVSLCDTANAGSAAAPGPCIGGVDMEGESGSSAWVSSNPPPYGEGLATPYSGGGTNGGFTVQIQVKAEDDNTDCTVAATECAVVSRNDHTRSSDRGQDVFVPVTFAGQSGDTGGGSGGSSGSGGEGSESGPGSGGSGSGSSGALGGSGEGSGSGAGNGPLALTGAPLIGLLLTAVVASVAGATALAATRGRTTGTGPKTT